MATSARRAPTQKRVGVVEAKKQVIAQIAKGHKVDAAMEFVGRSGETYRDWMKKDPVFKAEIQKLRSAVDKGEERPPIPDFPEFCAQYLNVPLPYHLRLLYEAVEYQREPDDLHPSMRYEKGSGPWEPREENPLAPAGRIIVNLPPGHGKTTSFTENYILWQIHRDPNIRIIIVCKDLQLGKDILYAIKFKLTSPMYAEMHARFAPLGGWRDPETEWAADRIRVAGITAPHKDPTVQALGIGGRIYGARSEIIVLDDAVTLANVNEYERQRKWLAREVESRLDGLGLLACVGTRLEPVDLYSHLRDTEVDWEGTARYTYLSMPALLEEGDGGLETWKPLWPAKFPPRRLASIRSDPHQWALIYQQLDVSDDSTFNPHAVEASVNGARMPGPLRAGVVGHPNTGMDGLYVVGGLDPAATGNTAMIVMALDRQSGKRYVLDGVNAANIHAETLIAHVQRLTEMYKINEWVIETNAVQRFIVQTPEMERWLRSRGVRITKHYTTDKKFDPDFGIQAMAQLFLTCGEPPEKNAGGHWKKTPETALIELPTGRQHAWARELVQQLVVWQPSGMKVRQKTDLVMALWFCNIAANRILDKKRHSDIPTHLPSPFLTPAQRSRQGVIDLSALREAKMQAELEAAQ